LRALSHAADIFVEDRLFATLDPLTREVSLTDQQRMVVTDTVGFIRKLPHHLVASFRATLEEVLEADVLLHVIDASHPYWEEQREVVDEVLADLGAQEKEMIYVFNKVDRLSDAEVDGLSTRLTNLLPNHVMVSAVRGDAGVARLREVLLERSRRLTPLVELRIDHGNGKLLAELHRSAEVSSTRHEADGTYVTARVDAATLARATRMGASVVSPAVP
jgi:GTP-binding protein HflX